MKYLLTLLLVTFIGLSSPLAQAQQLDLQQAKAQLSEAKEQGLVGEKADGYLGVVESTDVTEQIVKKINEARRKEYTRIANENDIAVADVELVAGKRAIELTKSGLYINVDGEWRKKP